MAGFLILLAFGLTIDFMGDGQLGTVVNDTSDDIEKSNYAPIANCTANCSSGEFPLTVEFTGSGIDFDGDVKSFYWDFGDGHNSEEQNPVHTFQTSGYYTVKMIVTDDDGNTNEDELIISVIERPILPTAYISSDKTYSEIGASSLNVKFTGSGHIEEGSIVDYHWDFDDGTTSSFQNPSHTFKGGEKEKIYTVTLTVTDNKERTATSKINITMRQYKQVTLFPCDYTFVDSAEPYTNFKDTYDLWVQNITYPSDSIRLTYLKYNLSTLPEHSKIQSSELKYIFNYVTLDKDDYEDIVCYKSTDDNWKDEKICWENRPSIIHEIIEAEFHRGDYQSYDYMGWTLEGEEGIDNFIEDELDSQYITLILSPSGWGKDELMRVPKLWIKYSDYDY